MATGAYDITLGIFLWSLAMLFPLLMIYVKNGEFKAALLTLVYPNLLSFLIRTGRFWISSKLIAGASIVAFLTSILLIQNSTIRKAFEDPTNNKAISASVFSVLILIFFIVIGVYASMEGMYNSNVD